MFGFDGVEISLLIVFCMLFVCILSGFPVGFAIGGAGILSFGVIALLDNAGMLIHHAIDKDSTAYQMLLSSGVNADSISLFRYPNLPTYPSEVFPNGVEQAMKGTISAFANRINERVLAGQSIETLLAVAMFVLMGITLERSKIANDLLVTMAHMFDPLPGGLAVSVIVVGAFLAASTGIVGATVVTMGLLSLPTMLRHNYSPELSTSVIAAAGTLGQIIPPSIVIVLLGTLAGDIYSTAQETRAVQAGCSDALTFLGKPAVVSVGTLFQSAILPGILLAGLYVVYAFSYAAIFPHKAPAIPVDDTKKGHKIGVRHALIWAIGMPVLLIMGTITLMQLNIVGKQSTSLDDFTHHVQTASLRTNVSPACQASMIDLHGQEAWDIAILENEKIIAANAAQDAEITPTQTLENAQKIYLASIAPLGRGVTLILLGAALLFSLTYGVRAPVNLAKIHSGILGIALGVVIDVFFITPELSPGISLLWLLLPFALIIYASQYCVEELVKNDFIRVLFPPLILIIAVLGSILGGITNPTPAAALGAGGALILAAHRRLKDEKKSGHFILIAAFSVIILILIGFNFDLRLKREFVPVENKIAFIFARIFYFTAIAGLLYACFTLWRGAVLTPIVRATAKVTSMVFMILIGSQLLNLVIISFGGEHYIQDFLKSFENELTVFLIVMLVLFILGFFLDFLEIIYIVVPIVGPTIYGGALDPKWVTVMIAINLQTSFLTPPFGFALFYLRGVAPKSVTTVQIYRGIIPFVIIQIIGLGLIYYFPIVVTFLPEFLGH